MRAVLAADLDTAARVMAAVSDVERPALMAALLAAAHSADKLRKRTGRAHPRWGDGTLAAAAAALPLALPPRRYDRAATAALAAVLAGLAAWRTDPARRCCPQPFQTGAGPLSALTLTG